MNSNTQLATASASKELAAFVVDTRYEHLNEKAVQYSQYALLDAIGVSIGASTLGEGVQAYIDWVKEQKATGNSAVITQGFKTSASLAAFANGALAHALDYEDAHDKALVHANAAVIPAVLAVAQSLPCNNGKDLITALTVGCEITCRLGFAVASNMDRHGWYPPPILSAYGATAAVASLLQLNKQQVINAFSLCTLQATCTAEIKHNPQSHIRAIRDAYPAQAGVTAAQLAQKGLVGFAEPLEGKDGFFAAFVNGEYDSEKLLDNLGKKFAVEDLSFKPWPSCRGTHVPIELSMGLVREHAFTTGQIKSIIVYSNALNCMLAEPLDNKRQPTTAIDAKFSIPFCVACAIVQGDVNLDSFSSATLQNQDVLNLARKINYEVDPSLDSPLMARVVVTLTDGRQIEAQANDALGCPERPLTEQQLIAKFSHCLSHSAKQAHHIQANQLANLILNLYQQTDLSDLFAQL